MSGHCSPYLTTAPRLILWTNDIFLTPLYVTFGLSGNFLQLRGSFFLARSLSVVHDYTKSRLIRLFNDTTISKIICVPVLGSHLYIIYTSGLILLLANHGC